MAIEQFYNYIVPDDDEKLTKWDRLGYVVTYDGLNKIVDSLQKYDESFNAI